VEADPVPLPELPAAVEVAAYRIAVEAVTNAVRHAEATRCRVRIEARDELAVEIEDDGRGIPADAVPDVGLESIRARAEELGGTVRLERPADGGTRVVARLPLAGVGTDLA
jgi:two-component system, NarL family, sensor kinase